MIIHPTQFVRNTALIVEFFLFIGTFFQINDSNKPAVATTKIQNHPTLIEELVH